MTGDPICPRCRRPILPDTQHYDEAGTLVHRVRLDLDPRATPGKSITQQMSEAAATLKQAGVMKAIPMGAIGCGSCCHPLLFVFDSVGGRTFRSMPACVKCVNPSCKENGKLYKLPAIDLEPVVDAPAP